MLSNETVMRNFLDGKSGKNRNMSTDGIQLFSYKTVIAINFKNKVYINTHKYSLTTLKQISQLKYLCITFYDIDYMLIEPKYWRRGEGLMIINNNVL